MKERNYQFGHGKQDNKKLKKHTKVSKDLPRHTGLTYRNTQHSVPEVIPALGLCQRTYFGLENGCENMPKKVTVVTK